MFAAIRRASRLTAIVTSDLVAHKGQTPCKRYCKLGHQTPYSRHRYPHKTLEIAQRDDAWSRPTPEKGPQSE
jgi:hypothetical protein